MTSTSPKLAILAAPGRHLEHLNLVDPCYMAPRRIARPITRAFVALLRKQFLWRSGPESAWILNFASDFEWFDYDGGVSYGNHALNRYGHFIPERSAKAVGSDRSH